jgi:hypothetical protein
MDEIEYLRAYPTNKKHILESMVSEPVISFTPGEFDKNVKELLKKSSKRE